jgi:Ser/Thr protein kinase RdoA (MazF antagonist)
VGVLPAGELVNWGQRALQQYALDEPALILLGHSDNITFSVEEPGGSKYLLRIHRPALNYWAGLRQLPEVIEAELAWMEALTLQGGFPVQKPVHSRSGRLVALVPVEEADSVPATLLTWLAGDHFSTVSPQAEKQIERLGALVARMHEFASYWKPPQGFIRPQYGLDHFRHVLARLLRGVDLGVFSEDIYRSLRAATQAILDEISVLPDGPEDWGMVHADLHMGNFLVTEGELGVIPIDFSFCGFGHYLFDISVCLAGGLKPSLIPSFLAGYREVRDLPEECLRAVEAYALTGRLSYYAYQIDNPAERVWLQRRIPEVVQNQVIRFLNGQRILFDL